MQCPRQVYRIDTGFITALSTRPTPDHGRLAENAVAPGLLRRSGPETAICYWKDRFGKEVDVVVREGIAVVQLVQVCSDIPRPDTREREVFAILRAAEELACDNLPVITGDYEGTEEIRKRTVRFVPLWRWLLDVPGRASSGR